MAIFLPSLFLSLSLSLSRCADSEKSRATKLASKEPLSVRDGTRAKVGAGRTLSSLRWGGSQFAGSSADNVPTGTGLTHDSLVLPRAKRAGNGVANSNADRTHPGVLRAGILIPYDPDCSVSLKAPQSFAITEIIPVGAHSERPCFSLASIMHDTIPNRGYLTISVVRL